MSKSYDKYQKRRLQSSYISVIVSITLVLFLVGVFGFAMIKSNSLASHLKEKVAMTLYLKDDISSKELQKLKKELQKATFTKRIRYTSKEQAAKDYSKELGEDFVKFLGANPLKSSIDVFLKADYALPKKMSELEKKLKTNQFVAEVNYDKSFIGILTKNIKRITFWLLLVSGFFVLIAFVLINSSIRLSVYSRRFNIKTMQMVGATKRFIRRPFILQSIKLGFLSALIAIASIIGLAYYLESVFTIALLKDYISLLYLVIGVFTFAFVITWISAYFATQRFLNLKTNDLYY